MTALPWWDRLPDDFYRSAVGTRLDALQSLKVGTTAAVDHLLRIGLGSVISAASLPLLLSRKNIRREMEYWPHYCRLADAGDSNAAFPAPRPDIPVLRMRPRMLSVRPAGVTSEVLRFDSPFVPSHPELRQAYSRLRANSQAYAQHWFHRGSPRPTLIVIHGFLADPYWLNSRLLGLRWFHQCGYDLLLYTLPFHGYRRERRDPFSGYRLVANGFSFLNEAMAQAIHDLRVFMDHLQSQGVRHIGVTGYSLGGYTAALMASVDARLSFCIPNSPVVSPIDLAREMPPLGLGLRMYLRRAGVGLAEFRHALACHSPLSYPPKISADRLLIIGGAGDRFVSPRQVRLLHEHWPGSRLHWFPGNHLLHLEQRRYLHEMRNFMDSHCGL